MSFVQHVKQHCYILLWWRYEALNDKNMLTIEATETLSHAFVSFQLDFCIVYIMGYLSTKWPTSICSDVSH